MELGSNEMIFTRNELQNLASGLVLLMDYNEKNNNGISSFKELLNLLGRINEQIDEICLVEGE